MADDEFREIAELRKEIDRIDGELIKLLAKRVAVVRRIGELKRRQGLDVWDEARASEVMRSREGWAREAGLDGDFAKDLFDRIVSYCARVQKRQSKS